MVQYILHLRGAKTGVNRDQDRPEWLHILFAVAKIGAVLVPINTRFRPAEVEYGRPQ